MDVVAMHALQKVLPGQHPPRRLHQLALAGDVVSNSLFYSIIPARTGRATWMRAAVLGTAAGVAALLLPRRLGLGAPPHSEQRANQVMTVAWYVAGAVTTALVASMSGAPESTRSA
jgi:hypothetical protein